LNAILTGISFPFSTAPRYISKSDQCDGRFSAVFLVQLLVLRGVKRSLSSVSDEMPVLPSG
jgi:hypothetical protein